MDEVLDLSFSVEVVVRAAWPRRRRRGQGGSRSHRVVDRKFWKRTRFRRWGGFFETVGSRVDLRGRFGFDGGDGAEAAAAVEVVLDGAGEEEAVDAVDDAVGSGHNIRVGDSGLVDGGEVFGEFEVVVGESGDVAC